MITPVTASNVHKPEIMRLILTAGLLLFSSLVFGQKVKGTLIDSSENKPLVGATVELQTVGAVPKKQSTTSNSRGYFEFAGLSPDSFVVKISFVNFTTYTVRFRLEKGGEVDLGRIVVTKASKELSEVVIIYNPPVRQKGDTAEYSTSQYKVNPDATGEDIVKKMPGITVGRDGTVTAQGETVQRVTIDGREYFGDDATAALRNLPAEVIDKIQVFDRLSDQAQFTGVDDGNTVKAINVVTKADMRNGQFGRLFAGYGTDDRYSAGGNMTFFKNNRRISLVGLTNNINQQNFASQDLLGVTSSSSGGRGGGGGGGRPGGTMMFGGNNSNFTIGQQSGISKTNALGINYSDQWGKNLNVTGSYFFNNSNNVNDQLLNRQQFLSNSKTQFYDERSINRSENFNHRVNMRVEWKIDSFNSITITPNLSTQKNSSLRNTMGSNSFSPTQLINESNNLRDALSQGFNFSNNVLYRHNFKKSRRTLSLNVNTSVNRRNSDTYVTAENDYYNSGSFLFSDTLQQYADNFTNNTTVSPNITYTEPVGKQGQLQFSYNPSFSFNKADQQTFQFSNISGKYSDFDTILSNKFDNTYFTHRPGITFRTGDRDNQFVVGLNYQYSVLSSDQVFPVTSVFERSFSNLLPTVQWRKKFSARSNVRFFYRTNVNAPSVTQLQNVINNSNPLFLSSGNPELDQQFNHTVVGRYTYTNTQKGRSFFFNVFGSAINDYITTATYVAASDSVLAQGITLFRGGQLSKPVNLSGYKSLRTFVTYGMPLKFIKSSINFNGGFSYTKAPGLINKLENFSNSYNYSGGMVLASNINEFVDFTISYSANYNVVKNTIQPQLDNNFLNQSAGFQLNLLSKKGWLFQNDLNNQSFRGLADGFNQSFWLWNVAVGKKFLKDQKGELRLSVFDLLKQNQSITRTATETYVQDVQNVVLQQYFMLTFTYKLKNFGKPASRRPAINNFRGDF